MFGKRFCCFILFALVLAACNLSASPPTPTAAPFTQIPLIIPTQPVISDPNQLLTPVGSTLPVEGLNPNCPLPAGWVTYVVEGGDSMGLLAGQTDSTINELTQANCMDNPDSIYVGQVLYVPRPPVVSQ
ncbi:Cortical fragment-lytic enzyme [Anaerolineae bacterium]|nr:Cortical fragment-lytic enzyme [Anaerolineae bacterium]